MEQKTSENLAIPSNSWDIFLAWGEWLIKVNKQNERKNSKYGIKER